MCPTRQLFLTSERKIKSNVDSASRNPVDLTRSEEKRRHRLPRLSKSEDRNPSRAIELRRHAESGHATRRPHTTPGVCGDSGAGVEFEDSPGRSRTERSRAKRSRAERSRERAALARGLRRSLPSRPVGTAPPGSDQDRNSVLSGK